MPILVLESTVQDEVDAPPRTVSFTGSKAGQARSRPKRGWKRMNCQPQPMVELLRSCGVTLDMTKTGKR